MPLYDKLIRLIDRRLTSEQAVYKNLFNLLPMQQLLSFSWLLKEELKRSHGEYSPTLQYSQSTMIKIPNIFPEEMLGIYNTNK